MQQFPVPENIYSDENCSESYGQLWGKEGDVHTSIEEKERGEVGGTIIASVKKAYPNGKVKKGKVVYSLVIRAAMQKGRCDGSEVNFDDNAVVLVDKQGQPIGTRVFGPPHELRKKRHVKILSLAGHIALINFKDVLQFR